MKKTTMVKFKVTRRRIYHFKCLNCKEDRITVHKKNLRVGWCKKCRGNMPSPGQFQLI